MNTADHPFIQFLKHNRMRALIAVLLGAAYGLLARWEMATDVMTVSFIFLVPLVIGFVSVWFSPEHLRVKVWFALFLPWLAGLCFVLGAMAVAFEGLICVVFMLPVVFVLSSVGGFCAKIIATIVAKKQASVSQQSLILASFLIIPFVSMPLENSLSSENRLIKTVNSVIRIHAPKAVVWRNIIRVPTIQPEEQTTSFFHRIGFPKPLEATLSHEGIGGVRHASFERGVVFTETITDWRDGELISFSIKANTEDIPPTTFDEHVTIGGEYFDILQGTYRIEEAPNGDVILHLSSEQRLSTNFNIYAGLWTGAIMQDIQSNILTVIKRRCEAQSQQ
ncbi:MAG: hypothetical protein MUF71_12840 [Candidatus Kapabacteria bacterium]|jgi:hypothetical protein|nr:hypothetical protein [Candidatus Kapabacteria bacterium]